MMKIIKYTELIMEPSDLTGVAILFISSLKSLFENNKHHYPDTSGVLDRLFEGYFQMKHSCPEKNRDTKEHEKY